MVNGRCAGGEGGTAAPPTQPDSRELATEVSAEVLSATSAGQGHCLHRRAPDPVRWLQTRRLAPPRPGNSGRRTNFIRLDHMPRPPPREATRLSWPPEDGTPGARWRPPHQAAPGLVPEPTRLGQTGSRLHGPHPTGTRVTSSDGEACPHEPASSATLQAKRSHGQVDEARLAASTPSRQRARTQART